MSYAERVALHEDSGWLLNIIMVVELQKLRLIKCPLSSWIEDIKFYSNIKTAFESYIDKGLSKVLWLMFLK